MDDATLAKHAALYIGELIARNGLEICLKGSDVLTKDNAFMTLQMGESAVRVTAWPSES